MLEGSFKERGGRHKREITVYMYANYRLVRWRFDNVGINYFNLSLTGILKLNLLREKFETTPSLAKTTEIKYGFNFSINQMCDVTVQDYLWRFADFVFWGLGRRLCRSMFAKLTNHTRVAWENSKFITNNRWYH